MKNGASRAIVQIMTIMSVRFIGHVCLYMATKCRQQEVPFTVRGKVIKICCSTKQQRSEFPTAASLLE